MNQLITKSIKRTCRFRIYMPQFMTIARQNILFSLMILLPSILSSCTHYYYVANVHNVPLFKEKNELRLSGSLGGGDESKCIEVQTAWSVTDHLGIMAGYMSAKGGDVSDRNYAHGNYFEGGVGYFKPLDKWGIFEIYGGAGHSGQHHYFSNFYSGTDAGNVDLTSLKIFIQPTLGVTSSFFDAAFSTRLCAVTFSDAGNFLTGNPDVYAKLNSLSTQIHGFLEPALTIRAGWKYTKLQFQAVRSLYLSTTNYNIGEDWHLSLGLNFSFANRFKSKKSESH